MADRNDLAAQITTLVDQRVALETKLQNEPGELSEAHAEQYDNEYGALQRKLAALFKQTDEETPRITLMLELMRILENRLVYLHNFIVDPTSDNRILAQLVTQFIEQLMSQRSKVLTALEATYYRAVATLYAGDVAGARRGFSEACASEESDEANDIKYKSYVILGHLSHEEHDYAKAKDLHDQSMRYSQNNNVTAQALALKALNSYALGDRDEALHLFKESLQLFDVNQPFFNSYFFRNALLFCGAIHFDSRDYVSAEPYYRRCWRTSSRALTTISTPSRTSAASPTHSSTTTTPWRHSRKPCRPRSTAKTNPSSTPGSGSPAPTSNATTATAPAPTSRRSPPRM